VFAVEKTLHAGYYRVVGYPDGSDWLIGPLRRFVQDYGVAGGTAWFYDNGGALQLFRLAERSMLGEITLADGGGHAARIRASRDGYWLYALSPHGRNNRRLTIIDAETGITQARHDNIPGGWRLPPVERGDGTWLIETAMASGDGAVSGVVLFDPNRGVRDVSLLSDRSGFMGFEQASPDGRYWLRHDPTALPVMEANDGAGRFLPWAGKDRYFGVTMQLWEAFPLRFLRRLTVAWLRFDELPDQTGLQHRGNAGAARQEVWDTISETLTRTDAGPLQDVPRANFPRNVAKRDARWKDIEDNRRELQRWAAFAGWQEDGGAFWIRSNGFLSCIGIDGSASPRLSTERQGMASGTWLPCAAFPQDVVPLSARRARVVYADGLALFDGQPSDTPHRRVSISKARDHWIAFDGEERKRIGLRIEALKAEHKAIRIALAAWREDAVIDAIEALTATIGPIFSVRAVDGEIRAEFVMGAHRYGEDVFFAAVREHFPGVAPQLKRMLERYVEVVPRGIELFWKGSEGIGIFGHAMRTLVEIDPDPFALLRRYGFLVDAGHEYFFAGTTIPALLRRHGWSEAMMDFMVWVLLRNYDNSLQDYHAVWQDWGIGGGGNGALHAARVRGAYLAGSRGHAGMEQ